MMKCSECGTHIHVEKDFDGKLRCGWCMVLKFAWVDVIEWWEPIDDWDYPYWDQHEEIGLLLFEEGIKTSCSSWHEKDGSTLNDEM